MKYYKNQNSNAIYAYEADGSQDKFIKEGLVQITDDEAKTLLELHTQETFYALTYVQKRQAEYPPATDYLDGIVKNDQAQIDAYITACQAVKAKYPKVGE